MKQYSIYQQELTEKSPKDDMSAVAKINEEEYVLRLNTGIGFNLT